MMSRIRFRITLLAFVLAITAIPLAAQSSPVKAKKNNANSHSIKGQLQPQRLPENLILPDGQVLPLADFIPRAEASQKELQQMLATIRTTDMEHVAISLSDLKGRVLASANAAEQTIELARSSLQLTEAKVQWTRDRSQLAGIDESITRYRTTLDAVYQRLQVIRGYWNGVATAAASAHLPPQFISRTTSIQSAIAEVDSALSQASNNVIGLQVQVSETRDTITTVLDHLDVAEGSLREQMFAMDSPPIWSAYHASDWQRTKQQIASYFRSAVSRSTHFISVYRFKLLTYAVFWCAMLGLILRLCREDISSQPIIDSRFAELLHHPYIITLFFALALFGVVFSNQPIEFARFIRILNIVPCVVLAFFITERRLRPYIAGLAAAYIIETLSVILIAGTLMRRIVALIIAVALVAALLHLLHRGGLLRAMFDEHGFTFGSLWFRGAAMLLAFSGIANIAGNVALSDTLGYGTILCLYWVLLLYVFYAATLAFTAAFIISDFGRKSRALRLHADVVLRTSALYLRIACWILWYFALLIAFQLFNAASNFAKETIARKWQLGAISISMLDVLLFCLVFTVSTLIARLIRFLLDEEIMPRTAVNPGVAQAGTRLTYSFLIILGMFLAFGAAGLELSKLTVLTGAFGVGLGFGLQNVVSNFVSGIILSLERPMKIGDQIEVSSLFGEVSAIGFRSSTVHTFDGADVIVPNSDFVTKSFVNWSLSDNLRRTSMQIGTAYGTDPDRVLAILNAIITTHPKVMRYPEPLITLDQFGESSLNFTVRFWSRLDDFVTVRSDINIKINEEFEKNGIAIPFPQRDLHLKIEGNAAEAPVALQPKSKRTASSQ